MQYPSSRIGFGLVFVYNLDLFVYLFHLCLDSNKGLYNLRIFFQIMLLRREYQGSWWCERTRRSLFDCRGRGNLLSNDLE